jgi:outer membrane immunogenic protein
VFAASGDGQLLSPHTLAFDSKDHLYVADRGHSSVVVFDDDGRFLATWKQFGRSCRIAAIAVCRRFPHEWSWLFAEHLAHDKRPHIHIGCCISVTALVAGFAIVPRDRDCVGGRMRKLLLTAAFGVLGLPAMAADLAPAYKAPPAVPVCAWCGFYVGLNAGGTWGDDNSVAVNSGVVQNFLPGGTNYGVASAAGASGSVPSGNHSGFIGGGQIGYNWQLSSAWIIGFEDDIQGISGNGRGTLGNTNPVGGLFFGNPDVVTTSITSTNKLDYLGTVRGRLGYLFTPAFLVYGTGGLAYGGAKASTAITQSNNDCSFTPVACIQPTTSAGGAVSQTLAGWTAGAGLEWLFTRQWSAKVEYLHYDLGSVTFANGLLVTGNGTFPVAGGPAIVNSTTSTQFRGDLVRAGVNFHWY